MNNQYILIFLTTNWYQGISHVHCTVCWRAPINLIPHNGVFTTLLIYRSNPNQTIFANTTFVLRQRKIDQMKHLTSKCFKSINNLAIYSNFTWTIGFLIFRSIIQMFKLTNLVSLSYWTVIFISTKNWFIYWAYVLWGRQGRIK